MASALKLVCLDLDGVIYRGEKPIGGAVWFIRKLIEHGIKYMFVTNSTLKSRSFYARKLEKMGIPTSEDQIITAAYATYRYLAHRERLRPFTAFLLAEDGLKKELSPLSCKFLNEKDSATSDYVIVALDRKITYEKICKATRDLLNGARFIGVNNDALWPVENGMMPGVGVFVAALRAATGKRPYIVGKPNTLMLKLAMERADASRNEVLLVGDKLDSDILMGNRAKVKTALVLTGVTSEEEALSATGMLKPDMIARDLTHLWNILSLLFSF